MATNPSSSTTTASVSGGRSGAGNVISGIFRGDVLLAVAVVFVLLFMLVPMPTWMLDIGLSLSITCSVMVLMTSLFIVKPLDFSTFPTVLLITTALRLSLNVASTRLILSAGHEGNDAAGNIIQAFGSFIIQDNYIVGGIVFAILVIVNFVVITKGSGRIAEVAARFTLDSMPGKQMAIDSDLSAGLIDEAEAKQRRAEVQSEGDFFGAMDGAAKFVRGDAIAGLLIVFINIIGGIVIGTVSNGLSLSEAASAYTMLTIGDGLVSQIPALIVSVSAGLLVSKAGVEGAADKALFSQFSKYPKALAITSVLLFGIGVVPGIPFLPFMVLSLVIGGLSYAVWHKDFVAAEEKIKQEHTETEKSKAKVADEPISKALAIDTIRLELGFGLLSLVQGEDAKLTHHIKGLRRQLAEELGYVLPSVRIQDNLQLPSNTYVVKIKEIEAGRGDIRPGMYMCMDPSGEPISLPGENTVEPTFGLPAMWIEERYQEEANFKGYTVVDAPTVITTHITEIVKDNVSDLLSYAETQKLLDELPQDYQKLVADTVPAQVSIGGLQRVLQALLAERVSIRDLPSILEGVAEASSYTKNPMIITEHVRSRISRQLCEANVGAGGYVPIVTLSLDWEQKFAESLIGDGEERQLSMPPSQLQAFMQAVKDSFDQYASAGENPVLLTSPAVRPYARSVIERFRPQTVIMSQNEIHPKARIKTIGSV